MPFRLLAKKNKIKGTKKGREVSERKQENRHISGSSLNWFASPMTPPDVLILST